MNIAIIPARGGSKRIPKKNIKEFYGKPMLQYAIEAALNSKIFEHVIVSTDDKKISEIALNCGATVPFKRPDELADDLTPTVPVIAHATQELQKIYSEIKNVCCIYPGVPFIQKDDIIGTLDLLKSSDRDYAFPITEFPSQIQRGFVMDNNNLISPIFPDNELTRTQDLEASYYDAGQFYWGSTNAWLTNNKIHSNGAGYRIPNWRVVDIDTQEDWERAERIYASLFMKTI
jgi:pseudaminic acid cytidylyltransferase